MNRYKEMQISILLCLVVIAFVLAFSCSAVGSESECVSSKITNTITVSQYKGFGQFTRIQDAIDSIPSNNKEWMRILVHRGTYLEQVTIPKDKQCVILQGHSPWDTTISFSAHNATDTSATFSSFADNFMARNIAFKNTFGSISAWDWKQAIAARVYGDKSAFYNCHFEGIQDTLWDAIGRHYYKSCYFLGAVDFIWGLGQSVFEDCDIKTMFDGFITAQGKLNPDDSSGFVFIGGKVHGRGLSYLGRAYKQSSRVVFHGTYFGRVINPMGWLAWHGADHEDELTFIEADCSGPGSDLSHRVPWLKRANATELAQYTVSAFIDQDGWISKQPNRPLYIC